jgi:hypothetical protein
MPQSQAGLGSIAIVARRCVGSLDLGHSLRRARRGKLVFGPLTRCSGPTFRRRVMPRLATSHSARVTRQRLRWASASGAEFIVMVCGDIMTMPGLPKVPSAEAIDVDENRKMREIGALQTILNAHHGANLARFSRPKSRDPNRPQTSCSIEHSGLSAQMVRRLCRGISMDQKRRHVALSAVARIATAAKASLSKQLLWICRCCLVLIASGWMTASAQTSFMLPQITITPENPTVNDDIQVRVQVFNPQCPNIAYAFRFNPNTRELGITISTITSAARGCDNTYRLSSLLGTGTQLTPGRFTVTARAANSPIDFLTSTSFDIRAAPAAPPAIVYDVPVNAPLGVVLTLVGIGWLVRCKLRHSKEFLVMLVCIGCVVSTLAPDLKAAGIAPKSEPRRIVVLLDPKADSRSADELVSASRSEFALMSLLGSPDKVQKLVARNVDRAHLERLKRRDQSDVLERVLRVALAHLSTHGVFDA